ncbi:MAG TPA: hypothetical protein VIF62_32575 [Labilithrix sp.]
MFVACSLDWSARGIERQAAPEASAPTDAPSGDANDSDAGDAGDASVDCTMLESQLADAKKSARTPCTLGSNDCRTTGVTDECGCTVAVIDDAGTPSTDLFASLASQVRASCNPSCDAGGCVTIAKGAWACLQAGTPAPTCYP